MSISTVNLSFESMKFPVLLISTLKEESKEESKDVKKTSDTIPKIAKSSKKDYEYAINHLSNFFFESMNTSFLLRSVYSEYVEEKEKLLKLLISELKLLNKKEKLISAEQINSHRIIKISTEIEEKVSKTPIYSKIKEINMIYSILLDCFFKSEEENFNLCLTESAYFARVNGKIQHLISDKKLDKVAWDYKKYKEVTIDLFNERRINFRRLYNIDFCRFIADQCKSNASFFLKKIKKLEFDKDLMVIFKDNIDFFKEFLQLATDEGQGAMYAYKNKKISMLLAGFDDLNLPKSVISEVIMPYLDANDFEIKENVRS